jgi:hypothetical protein
MQAPGGPGEDEGGGFPHGCWLVPHADEDMGKTMVEIFSKVDAFLIGRTTYDIFTAYWLKITNPDDLIAVILYTLPKYVSSRTRTTFSWNGTAPQRFFSEDHADIEGIFTAWPSEEDPRSALF